MDIGSFALVWAVVPLVLAMGGYLMVAVGARQYQLSAKIVYWVLLGLVGIAFVDLFILFLTDKFQYSYVSSYSSSDLTNAWPHFYKISALWAGQQGTFILWLVFGLLLGFWVKSKAKENEGWVMFFYILGQAFLLVLAIVSKPFEKLDFIPADGQGLNPLLQNYWMQIHPPIVFIGFAAACIPFAFAMAALATNKYEDWVKQTMPWAVFSVVTLGLGIFLGGYWAYETLGWGGYWSWDPVENASIIPWLVGIALIHGMVIERIRGSWRRTNLFLAISLFLLIVYGTFLTRSGVLADFSVHSFVDLGYNNILWASIIILALVSYGLWGFRIKKIKGTTPGNTVLSQEFTTFLSVALLLPFTMLVLFWTSFPLITTIFSKVPILSKLTPAPAAIASTYYNIAGLIFAAIFAIILGFNSLLYWKNTETRVFIKKLIPFLIVATGGAVLFIIFGFGKIVEFWSAPNPPAASAQVIFIAVMYFLFFFASLFSLFANCSYIFQNRKVGFGNMGGYLAHVGFSLLLIGIILSSSFGSKSKITIAEGGSKAALGYDIKFTGTERTKPKEERANFDVVKGSSSFKAFSTSKEMSRGGQLQYVREPFIKKSLFSDLYISLENLTDNSQVDMKPFQLKLGESIEIAGYGIKFSSFDSNENKKLLAQYEPQLFTVAKGESFEIGARKITFEKFDMGQHKEGNASKIGAKLNVEFQNKSLSVVPSYEPLPNGEHKTEPVELPGGGALSIMAIRADIGSVTLAYSVEKTAPNVKVGTILDITSNSNTSRVTTIYDPSTAHGESSMAALPDGGTLFLVNINAKEDSASYVIVPKSEPVLATIEISTKPMINLVWFGFTIIVIGAAIAFYRRMKESKSR